MKVTIEGNLEQVTAALSGQDDLPKTPRQIRLAENAGRRKVFVERRKLVRQAFEKVRYSEIDRETSEALLNALRRTSGVTDGDHLEIARQVLAASISNGER